MTFIGKGQKNINLGFFVKINLTFLSSVADKTSEFRKQGTYKLGKPSKKNNKCYIPGGDRGLGLYDWDWEMGNGKKRVLPQEMTV